MYRSAVAILGSIRNHRYTFAGSRAKEEKEKKEDTHGGVLFKIFRINGIPLKMH